MTIFPRKSKTGHEPVKISVNGTKGKILFSQGRVGENITQSKIALTVPGYNAISQERVRLKINQSKLPLTVQTVR